MQTFWDDLVNYVGVALTGQTHGPKPALMTQSPILLFFSLFLERHNSTDRRITQLVRTYLFSSTYVKNSIWFIGIYTLIICTVAMFWDMWNHLLRGIPCKGHSHLFRWWPVVHSIYYTCCNLIALMGFPSHARDRFVCAFFSSKFVLLKYFISWTMHPNHESFALLRFSRRDLQNYIPWW